MKWELLLKILPLALFSMIVVFPMLFFPYDMWDGTIIEYASLIKNFSGLQSYFFESNWFLQYFLSLAVIKISDFFGISFKNTNALVIFIFMCILLHETFLFAKYQIKISEKGAYFSALLVAVFSVWGDLLSSIMTFHFICMAIGLLSLRAIHTGEALKISSGFIGIAIALSLQSQSVYLPIFSYLYDLSKSDKFKEKWMVRPSTKTVLIFLISIILYTVIRNFYPPHGLYENYNNLILLSFEGLLIAGKLGLAFVTFLAPIIFIGFFLTFLSILNERRCVYIEKKRLSFNPKWLLWLLVLFIAGVFPYVAVGKGSTLWELTDWNSRQAFLIVIPTSLITAVYLQILYEKASTSFIRHLVLIAGIFILFLNVALLSFAVIYKSNRQIFESQLESQIRLNESLIRPGILEIVGDGIPGPKLREYESNFLMYKATGKAQWWTKVSDQSDYAFTVPCFIKNNPAYQIKYIYNYKFSHIGNHTVVRIDVIGFTGLINLFKNFFGYDPVSRIELISIEIKENNPLQKLSNCD